MILVWVGYMLADDNDDGNGDGFVDFLFTIIPFFSAFLSSSASFFSSSNFQQFNRHLNLQETMTLLNAF